MKADLRFVKIILAILALPTVTVVALWIPFGFSLGGLVEEWDFLFLFTRDGVFYIAGSASPLQFLSARPLTVLPWAIAYTLDPNSFFYWHIIQAVSLIVKGACAGIIGIYLTENLTLAALLGLLTLLYPADTMQLSFRSLAINWAVALALVASVLILFATKLELRRSRIVTAIIASMIIAASLLMYEVVIGLAVLPVLVIVARHGQAAVRLIRDRRAVFIVWIFTIVTWAFFFLWKIKSGSQYQQVLAGDASLGSIVSRMDALASSGLYRAFYECWMEIGEILLASLSNFAYPLCFTLIILAAFVWLGTDSRALPKSTGIRLAARMLAAGLIAFLFAYAPYLYTPSHLIITQRTFLAAAIGGALVVVAGVAFLSAFLNRRVVAVVSSLLIGGCFVAQLYQFDKYNRIYATSIRPLLSALTPFIAGSAGRPYSVIFNDYGYLSGTWDLGIEVEYALGYELPGNRAGFVNVCEARSGRLLPRRPGPLAQRGYCQKTEGGILLALPGEKADPVLLKDGAVGDLAVDGVVSVEGSGAYPSSSHPLSSRVSQLFALSKWRPADSMFRRQEKPERFECRFDSMWGYALPCRTFGFFEAVPQRAALGSSYAWIGEKAAGLIFDIRPRRANYRVAIEILNVVSPSPNLEITLNGTKLTESSRGALIEAIFPSYILQNKNNILELHTELDDNLGLSFAIRSISITPVQGAESAPRSR